MNDLLLSDGIGAFAEAKWNRDRQLPPFALSTEFWGRLLEIDRLISRSPLCAVTRLQAKLTLVDWFNESKSV